MSCRRRGSAMALKTSVVVAARGMLLLYSHMGICQALNCRRNWRSSHALELALVLVAGGCRGRRLVLGVDLKQREAADHFLRLSVSTADVHRPRSEDRRVFAY